MKESTINKTTIVYKKIRKSKEDLDQMGIDGWLPAFSEEDGWILYKKIIQKITKVLTETEDAWERFWKLYPKKTGRHKTELKFFLIDPKEYDNLFAGLDQHLILWREDIIKKNLKFIPNAETWINGKRWIDEVETPLGSFSQAKVDKQKKIMQEEKKIEDAEKRDAMRCKKQIEKKIEELERDSPGELEKMKVEAYKTITKSVVGQALERTQLVFLRMHIQRKYFPKKNVGKTK